jgi:hypothetical protein
MKNTIILLLLLFVCNLMWSLQFTCIKLTQELVDSGVGAIYNVQLGLESQKIIAACYESAKTGKTIDIN